MSNQDVVSLRSVQVLYFNVFGTVVDYVETVTKALRREIADTSMADSNLLQVLQRDYDWQHFTIMWRQEYKFETKRLADIGNPHKVTVDQMHMNALNRLISALPLSSDDRTVGGCSIDALSKSLDQSWTQDVRDRLNFAWHLLEPWPDSVAGMQALQSRFKIGTLTNGNLNLMLFDIQPHVDGHRACMVAAHLYDLEAAKACGMTTVFVSSRATEDQLPAQGKPHFAS
ncbi:hypothetical protein [Sporisorium scitamineum]|uniref:Haloacid dehalogenase n=1 Tax=Sporisorium scitamineum TaxID=49012 RepID=A0A0F7S7V2_9BASI|nr:hypothetical protein [Sporisorium scitamineum]